MNILFVNANLYGHINPTLGLVKKLTERENEVILKAMLRRGILSCEATISWCNETMESGL